MVSATTRGSGQEAVTKSLCLTACGLPCCWSWLHREADSPSGRQSLLGAPGGGGSPSGFLELSPSPPTLQGGLLPPPAVPRRRNQPEHHLYARCRSYLANGGLGFSGGSVGKNPSADAGDTGSIPGSGRPPWRRKWQPLQYSCLGKSLGQRRATVHRVAKESDPTQPLVNNKLRPEEEWNPTGESVGRKEVLQRVGKEEELGATSAHRSSSPFTVIHPVSCPLRLIHRRCLPFPSPSEIRWPPPGAPGVARAAEEH